MEAAINYERTERRYKPRTQLYSDMTLDTLPHDVLRILVYSSGLARVEDRTALVLSCKAVLYACGGVDVGTGRISADGGEAHWRREAEAAGFVRCAQKVHPHPASQPARTLYFDRKAKRCASCGIPISHRTGRISTTGYQGQGVRLVSCVRCGPLMHVPVPVSVPVAPVLRHVFGRYTSRRQYDVSVERMVAAQDSARVERRVQEVRDGLLHAGMLPRMVESALAGSVAFNMYVSTVTDGVGLRERLDGTVSGICCSYWMQNYTWLPCARAMCGTPCSDATRDDLCRMVLTCYGGYPIVWPWTQDTRHRDLLADAIVKFYADNMMLDSLFQRLVRNELCWLGDHAWLHKVRDAAVRLGPSKRSRSGMHARVTFVVPPNVGRATQLALQAEAVGGYRVRRSAWHVTFSVL